MSRTTWRACLLMLLCAAAAPADACRCAERDLADYFHAADEVVMGRLLSAALSGAESHELILQFELPTPPYKSRRQLTSGDRVSYVTASSSAGCGVAPDEGGLYVLFANVAGESESSAWHVDTCSGTRLFLSGDERSYGEFRDVPARFVAQQLNGLAALTVLSAIVVAHPDPRDPHNETLVGLLDVSGFSHAGHALLRPRPDHNAGVLAKLEDYDGLITRELGYETPAAVVYAEADGWYRLKTESGDYGWLPPEYAGTYVPYEALPVRRLAYLQSPWHGFLWPQPGAGLPARILQTDRHREQPVEILESTYIGGSLWFRVNVMQDSPCEGGDADKNTGGWIPGYRQDGSPIAWFYSRGC